MTPARTAHVLRLSRRALDPPAHHQPHRVHLRHRAPPHQRSPRARVSARPGWPWHSSSSSPHNPLASGQRTPPRRPRPRRGRQAGRTTRRTHHTHRSLKDLDPHVLNYCSLRCSSSSFGPSVSVSSLDRTHTTVRKKSIKVTITQKVIYTDVQNQQAGRSHQGRLKSPRSHSATALARSRALTGYRAATKAMAARLIHFMQSVGDFEVSGIVGAAGPTDNITLWDDLRDRVPSRSRAE